MAVSTTSYFSNGLVGQMQIGSDIDIRDTHSVPKFAVGVGFQRADGNCYRYVHFGALTGVAQCVGTDNLESSTTSTAMSLQVLAPTLYKPSGDNLNPNVPGSRYIQINNTGANFSVAGITQAQFAGGTICFLTGSGTGFSYRIKCNSASGTPATGETYIELYDPLKHYVDTTTAFIIQGSKYANLEPAQSLSARWALPVGFATQNHTAGYYGWVCTKGVTSGLQGVPLGSLGNLVCLSTTTAGSVNILCKPIAGNSTQCNVTFVGILAQTYSESNYCLVDAKLE